MLGEDGHGTFSVYQRKTSKINPFPPKNCQNLEQTHLISNGLSVNNLQYKQKNIIHKMKNTVTGLQAYFEALLFEWQRNNFGGAGFGRAVSRK